MIYIYISKSRKTGLTRRHKYFLYFFDERYFCKKLGSMLFLIFLYKGHKSFIYIYVCVCVCVCIINVIFLLLCFPPSLTVDFSLKSE